MIPVRLIFMAKHEEKRVEFCEHISLNVYHNNRDSEYEELLELECKVCKKDWDLLLLIN